MCTYCGEHCVEDEPFRLSKEELESGTRVPENTCPYKDDITEEVMQLVEERSNNAKQNS